jgi:hypothetical protein
MKPRTLFVLPVVLAVAGCFGYVPADLADVAVDDHVRARLNEDARAYEELGLRGPVLSGRVLERRPDTLLLRVPLEAQPGTRTGPPLARHIPVPETAIERLEVRELKRTRTAGIVLGTAGLMGYILYQAFERSDPRGERGENPPPSDEAVWTIPLRFP